MGDKSSIQWTDATWSAIAPGYFTNSEIVTIFSGFRRQILQAAAITLGLGFFCTGNTFSIIAEKGYGLAGLGFAFYTLIGFLLGHAIGPTVYLPVAEIRARRRSMIGIPLLGYLVSKETIQAPVAATRGQRSSGLAHQLRLMVRIISRRLSTLAARSLPVVVTVVFVVLLDKLFVGMVSPPLYSGDLRTLASSTNGGMISLLSLMLASIVFLRGRLSTGTVEDELQDIRFFRHEIQERLSEFGANINVKGRKQATDRLSSLSDRASQVKDASVYSLPFIFGGIGGGLRELQTMGTKEGWLDSDLKNEISGLRNDVLSMFKRVFAIIDILPLLGRGFKFMIFAAVGTLILGGTIVSFSSSPSSPDLLSGSLFLVHAGLVSYALVWTGRFLVGIVRRWFSLRE